MAAGKLEEKKYSPILLAILKAEEDTTGEVRVHLSHRLFERDAYAHALRIFHRFGMQRTTHRNAVLLYVNLKRRRFAIVGDEGIHKAVGQEYWDAVARRLRENLMATHPENAVAHAVEQIGDTLRKFFPLEPGEKRRNELPDEVTEG